MWKVIKFTIIIGIMAALFCINPLASLISIVTVYLVGKLSEK